MSKWTQLKLGDVITLKRGFDLPNSKRENGGYPIVSSSGVTDWHQRFKIKAPGVVTGRYGTIGHVYYIADDFWPLNTTLFVEDFKNNNPKFISYFLQTLDFQAYAAKSAVPGINRNDLHLADVTIPDIHTQLRISEVLSIYDELIENNNRRIAILEEMAQRLYREWFVHFRFPGHENVPMVESELGMIPEGWTAANLFDCANVQYGYPFRSKTFTDDKESSPVVRIRDILGNETNTFSPEIPDEKYILNNGDILIGMDGIFHMNQWAGGRAYINQRVVKICPKYISTFQLYYSLLPIIKQLEKTISGTTVAHLSDADLKKVAIIIADDVLQEKTNALFQPLLSEKLSLIKKNNTLRKTRDLLLPRLISGDIDVSKIDIPVEDVSQ